MLCSFCCTMKWISCMSASHPTHLGLHRAPCALWTFPLATCCAHGGHCTSAVSILTSQSTPPSPSPPVSTSALHICVSLSALQIGSSVPFSRFYIYVLIYWLNGHEFGQIPRESEGQGSLACCSPRGCKKSDMIYRLNNNSNYMINKYCCEK